MIKLKERFCNNLLAWGIATLISLLFMFLYLSIGYEFVRTNITASNLMPYVLLIALFILVYLVSGALLAKNRKIAHCLIRIPNSFAAVISCLIMCGILVAVFLCYQHELELFAAPAPAQLIYHLYNNITFATFFFVFCLCWVFMEKTLSFTGNSSTVSKVRKVTSWLFVASIGFLYWYSSYTTNTFTFDHNCFHNEAYFNSVYSTMEGTPRSSLNASVYGFYAMLLAPIVMIFGGSYNAFLIVLYTVALLSFFGLAYSLFKLVGYNLISYLGTFAMIVPSALMTFDIYRQGTPHRTIILGFFIAYICYLINHKVVIKKKDISVFCGYLLCMLGLVWNFETGIVYLISFFGYLMINRLQKFKITNRKFWEYLILHIINLILTILFSWSSINIANIVFLRGEFLTFTNLLFPLQNTEYMSNLLTDYQPGIVLWMFIASISSVLLAYGFNESYLNASYAGVTNRYSSSIFTVALLTLGQMAYYMNRQAYGNIYIAIPIAIIALCILIKFSLEYLENKRLIIPAFRFFSKGISCITVTVLTVFCAAGIANYGNCETVKTEGYYRETTEIERVESEIRKFCPVNTIALGPTIPQLYSDLGWDSHYHVIDFADMEQYPKAYAYLLDELNGHLDKPILLDNHAKSELEKKVI